MFYNHDLLTAINFLLIFCHKPVRNVILFLVIINTYSMFFIHGQYLQVELVNIQSKQETQEKSLMGIPPWTSSLQQTDWHLHSWTSRRGHPKSVASSIEYLFHYLSPRQQDKTYYEIYFKVATTQFNMQSLCRNRHLNRKKNISI